MRSEGLLAYWSMDTINFDDPGESDVEDEDDED